MFVRRSKGYHAKRTRVGFVELWIQNEADLACFTHIVRLCDTREVLEKNREQARQARQMAG